MATHVLFRVNRPQVICQTIEGEVVVINLHTGSYYSLTGAAAAIWDALEHGAAPAQITNTLSAHFTDCDVGLENIVGEFLDELRGESLIVPAENGEAKANGALNGAQIQREKFIRPALKKFTDMQELLLLDPIHEVDATGWPLAKPDPNHDADK
jgi:Coenzyme PQQ synthesis protein D (PqqD)